MADAQVVGGADAQAQTTGPIAIESPKILRFELFPAETGFPAIEECACGVVESIGPAAGGREDLVSGLLLWLAEETDASSLGPTRMTFSMLAITGLLM